MYTHTQIYIYIYIYIYTPIITHTHDKPWTQYHKKTSSTVIYLLSH